MNEVLGLLDSLEATFLEAPRVPLTNKLIVEEKKVLQIIDKVRLAIKNGNVVRQSVDILASLDETVNADSVATKVISSTETVVEAQKKAKKVKEGANDYAEYVLASLQLTVTKMQKNIGKLEKNIMSGRDVLEKQKNEEDEINNETR